MTKFRPLLIAGLFAVTLSAAGTAQAAPRDSDHDGMPNSFEKRYHLKVHGSDAAKDKDKDGLGNLSEYQAGTNPRKTDSDRDGTPDAREDCDEDGVENEAEEHTGSNPGERDSDDDGVDDGDEGAGDVVAFAEGVLTIELASGEKLTGKVTDGTEIECRKQPAPVLATPANEDGESRHGSEGEDSEDDASCTSALLAPGVAVREAEVEEGVFKKVHLA